jgi:hypothetical protein
MTDTIQIGRRTMTDTIQVGDWVRVRRGCPFEGEVLPVIVIDKWQERPQENAYGLHQAGFFHAEDLELVQHSRYDRETGKFSTEVVV